LNPSTLVEHGAFFSCKADVASKLHVTVEVEVIVLPGEGGVLEVVLEVLDVDLLEVDQVEERNVPIEEGGYFEDLQVVLSGHMLANEEASSRHSLPL